MKKFRFIYISNTELKESGGGGSGVNSATFNRLKLQYYNLDYILIKQKIDLLSKFKSVLLKKIGVKRNYHHFSEKSLNNVKTSFDLKLQNLKKADFLFFHGFTPWIKIKPSKPYFCFNDGSFYTYLHTSNNPNEFSNKDTNRIFLHEKQWLENAEKVFFRSNWALEQTKKAYNIKGENFLNVGVGGAIAIPKKDMHQGGRDFLFISTDFLSKGGQVVIEAFKKIKSQNSDANLWIIGDNKGMDLKGTTGVNYLGFFNKNNPEQQKKLYEIFEKAFTLVYPTLKDINPLVVIELSYFGCPIIASNKFAIPEYVIDGKTGFLINDPRDVDEIAHLMNKVLKMSKTDYLKMRKNSREFGVGKNTWDKVVERIIVQINSNI
ncbi:glycosyltransferase family 1 protein [Arenibacter aquaticus]|uniref:Glycosyltransferase family 1 protein n=1 Tax=Arenibacter aquaticus TaxID=2489054 RepID=A0A430JY54_9FLAO|nr:glycosyltransferase [Arenibacter aquaticus]RTE51723.1 glycosyltransferase family 1 protein [Arenibacter aquaticus]